MTLHPILFTFLVIFVITITFGLIIYLLKNRSDSEYIDSEFILNHSSDFIFILDAETGKFLLVNDAMVQTFAFTKEEFDHLYFNDILYNPKNLSISEFFDTCHERKECNRIIDQKTKSGRILKCKVKEELFSFNERKAILVSGHDITEQYEKENELLKQFANVNAIIENTEDAIWAVDVEGKVTVINENYKKMYWDTFQKEINIGDDIFKDCNPTQKIERKKYFDKALQGEFVKFDINSVRHNTTNLLEGFVNPIKLPDGTITGVSYFCRDITKEKASEIKVKQTEDKYKRLIETMIDGIVQTNQFDEILFANDNFYRMTEYSVDEILGKGSLSILLDEEGKKVLESKIKLRSEGVADQYELKIYKKSGAVAYVIVSGSPTFDESGNYTGSIATFTDITVRKEVEEKIKGINQELDQFAYIISHDLKAPLRAIQSLSTWIQEDISSVADEETIKNLSMLRSRVSRMESLINGVLDYSRVGRQKAKCETINVAQLVEEVKEMLSPDDKFEFNLDLNIQNIDGERLKLQQVFSNLISNAIKYHDKEHGKINILARDKNEFIEFEVKDDGPGIDPQYHEIIFKIFQTLHSRDTIESTGVGLTIVKKIIQEAGGEIRVESALGQGTAFIFTWPKRQNNERGKLSIAA